MNSMNKSNNENQFEKTMKVYLHQGKEKLESDLEGTREAIKLIALEKTRDFMRIMDKGLDKDERDFLTMLIISGMYQSFCYGYGLGKMEGKTNSRIVL